MSDDIQVSYQKAAENNEYIRREVARLRGDLRKAGQDALFLRDDLLKELAALKAEVARLREDKERLDWLEHGWRIGLNYYQWNCCQSYGPTTETKNTLRTAIDAACKAALAAGGADSIRT